MSRPDPAPDASSLRLYGSIARLLRAASLVLALLFALRVLFSLAPLRSGPLAVALRLCDGLVSQAPFAVIAVCLLALSLLIDEECPSSRRLTHSLRAAAVPVAIGYLLLIPLYGTARWWRAQAEASALRNGLQTSLSQLQSARQGVLRAGSDRELQRVLAALPAGSPPLERFGSDLPRRRGALVRFLDQVDGILNSRLQGVEQRLLTTSVRDTGLYSLACLGLAALFYRSSQLDLPTRSQRLRLAGGGPANRRGRGHGDPLQGEIERLLRESGAAEDDPSDPAPESAHPPAADRNPEPTG